MKAAPPITDNLLLGEGNSTPHGALIGKCVWIVKWKEFKKETDVLSKRPTQNFTRSLSGLNPRLWSENCTWYRLSYSGLGPQIYECIHRFINLIISKLTSKNWNSSRNVEDIEEEVDTTAHLKWTKPNLKHLSPVIPNRTKYPSNALASFEYVLSQLLFVSVRMTIQPQTRNSFLPFKLYNLNVTNNNILRKRIIDRKSCFEDGNEQRWLWRGVN